MWGNNPPLGKTQQSQQREKLNSQKLQIIHLSDRSGNISMFRMADMKEIISMFQNNMYERERERDRSFFILIWKDTNSSTSKNNFCNYMYRHFKNSIDFWASLVAQWLRICLPMQEIWVWALVQEDPTCRGATKPVCHNYWACASGACAPQQERLRWWEARTPRWRVAPACRN